MHFGAAAIYIPKKCEILIAFNVNQYFYNVADLHNMHMNINYHSISPNNINVIDCEQLLIKVLIMLIV